MAKTKLRTNYQDGEELLAYDVNLITETINTLNDNDDSHSQEIEDISTEITQINSDIEGINNTIGELDQAKQDKLTAGINITIDENNVISAASTDLSEYAKKSYVDEKVQDEADRVDELVQPIAEKVSGIETGAQVNKIETVKVNGSALPIENKAVDVTVPTRLSQLTNDDNYVKDASYVHTDNNFTTAEKNKLQGIATGAEVNVQSDWNVTNTSSDAYIKNKPQNLVQDANYVHTDNNYTTAEKNKLASLENYELPQASATTLGGIKVGENLSIDWDGVLSAEDSKAILPVDELPEAATSTNKLYRLSTDNKVYMSMLSGTASDEDQINNAYFNFYIEDAWILWDYYYKGAVNVQCSNGTVTLYRWWTDDTSYFTKFNAIDQVIETPYLSSFLGAEDTDLQVTLNESTGVYSTPLTAEQVQNLVNTNLAATHDVILYRIDGGYTWKEVATMDEVAKKQDRLTAGSNITITNNTISSNQIDDTQNSSTKTWSSSKIASEIADAGFEVQIVQTLPQSGENHTIYFVPASDTGEANYYDEFMWVDGAWEKIGSTEIDLSNYYTRDEAATTAEINALFA